MTNEMKTVLIEIARRSATLGLIHDSKAVQEAGIKWEDLKIIVSSLCKKGLVKRTWKPSYRITYQGEQLILDIMEEQRSA